MYISIGVIAHNEENTMRSILEDILAQDYPHENIEVVLVDSASTDGTKKIMQELCTLRRFRCLITLRKLSLQVGMLC